jgi:hypothetical protein
VYTNASDGWMEIVSLCSREHISYKGHSCPSAYKKDVQVPVCPLCNTPIPVKRGEQPDITVGAHIDSDCMSDPAKNRRKVTFKWLEEYLLLGYDAV